MKISQVGLDLIKWFEGLETKAYRCPAGILTIGYGHTAGVKEEDTGTPEQTEAWLREDCRVAELNVSTNVNVYLNQNQFYVLVSLIFYLGPGNCVKSNLLKKLNTADNTGVADEPCRRVNPGGCRLARLVKRDAAEKVLFLS